MDAIPPPIDEPRPVAKISGGRWAIHLLLITAYLVALTFVGLDRAKSQLPSHPALSHTVHGLLAVCAVELFFFGLIFGLAWLASRATIDELLLRWRGNVLPILLGAAYSIGLRVLVGMVAVAVAAVLIATRLATTDSLSKFAEQNRPGVENAVDVGALQHNPVYLILTLTVVSFVLAGFREELWRSSFLAGMRGIWPRQFSSMPGQICAVFIAAAIFGTAHLSMGILAAGMAGVLGVGLGLIMVFHRSIWPAVIAHGFFDATSMALIPWAMNLMRHLPTH